ncbi:MAG TPA: isoleucine--tRNA ligase [Solirubrobacteraceae bacterium]|nr:isoleucine--tRNA ligase [Solirubrobacteraceae bacterium]
MRAVDAQADFPALEQAVLERWRARDVFRESLRRREGAPGWVFYEGPPTANGRPGSHHVLSRVFKDIFPRFKTMRGFYVERKGGWDCHGLPVEIAVEQQLGISSKEQIEAYGIAEFNQRCRESVFAFLEEWDALTERIGFWIDLDAAYRTLDTEYVESVWWALQRIHEKGLLYEGHRVVPYCPRCGTALSSHEVAVGYREVTDPSVYVRFPVRGAHGVGGDLLEEGDELAVWTTTPWTLVSNAAVAAHPDLIYARARAAGGGPVLVLAQALVERVLGEGAEVLDTFPGSALEGVAYEPPFPFIAATEYGERGHTVLPADFVTAADGTGLVHTAIAFGEDDFQLGRAFALAVVNPVRPDGTYDERIGPYADRFVKDADADLVEDLRARGKLLRSEDYQHAYPHCWRCSTPLIYYAKPSWYIATSQVRDRLLAANETITWHPEHIKYGRFGDWLANNVDWALSRERYWGTPLPIWRCTNDHRTVIGSLAELQELSGVALEDPHRPFVDDVIFACPQCGEESRRVPEVIDVWFDSGAMPFAQYAAPLSEEGREHFEARFPAQFICEALDQTRGWFYSLLAVSTLLYDRSSYENVVCLGLILDAEGQKMSKSRGNTVAPWEVIERFGADALRWYFFTSKQPWDGYRFSMESIGEGVRLFLRQLWNTLVFLQTYRPEERVEASPTELDRWVRSRLAATVEEVTDRLEHYDATTAGRAIATFVDELSNWYVRRSRRRFWEGDPAAFATLRECLVTTAKLLAPFTPFVADEVFEVLDGGEPSVHLCDWPVAAQRDRDLEHAMGVARETVRLGLAARGGAKVKVRQPLHEAVVVAAGPEREAIERLGDIVREELNVRELRFVGQADELGSHSVKPNYRTLGPRFGKAMPQAAAAVAQLDPARVADALREGRTVGVFIDGEEYPLDAQDLQLALQPLEGYQLEREGSHAVALELTLDDDLRREGLAREVVHAVQGARKAAGLAVEDRIELTLGGDQGLIEAARTHEDYVTGETLAVEVEYDGERAGEAARIEGRELFIAVTRA